MTANSPCAIYNFYNCCGNGNGSSAAQSAPFIWHSGLVLDPTGTGSASTELLEAVGFVVTNRPNAALKAYWGLTPLHKKAQLKEIMLLRLPEQTSGPAYTATINFDLVVMDFNGVFVRQISTVALDFRVIPLRTWTPITLSAVAGDLDVEPGQLIAGRLTFGAAVPAGTAFTAVYQLSGTGVLL